MPAQSCRILNDAAPSYRVRLSVQCACYGQPGERDPGTTMGKDAQDNTVQDMKDNDCISPGPSETIPMYHFVPVLLKPGEKRGALCHAMVRGQITVVPK